MYQFIRDVVIFCGINLSVLGMLYYRYDISADYLASANDKLDRLEVIESPRLLFIGGSSVAWSNHSQVAKNALGDRVKGIENVAYHAGLGLSMRLNEARMLARKEDIVVLSIEWGVFPDSPWARKMAETAMVCPRTLKFMTFRDKKLVLDGLLPAIKMPLGSLIYGLKGYGLAAFSPRVAQEMKQWRLREHFNDMGDFEGHYGVDPPGLEGREVKYPTEDQLAVAIQRINEVGDELVEKGVHPYFFIPIVAEHGYAPRKDVAEERVAQLKQGLTIPILNPDTYVYPTEWYFDSCYHMKDEPGKKRTELLVSALIKELEKAGK